jgi:glycosyltransferase involved in cell wall biosynthesis
MKVLYDHQIFTVQRFGGISRYFADLILSYGKKNEVTPLVGGLYSENAYLTKYFVPFFIKKSFFGKKTLKFWLNSIYQYCLIRKKGVDLIHPTYYSPYFLKIYAGKPLVITVYDMIHELYPVYFKSADQTAYNKKKLALLADKIIAISESTKNDIIKLYGVPEYKITVVCLSSSLKPLHDAEIRENISLPASYVLFVGQRAGYKNFDKFVHAIGKRLKLDFSLHLVCAGGGAFTEAENCLFQEYDIQHKVHRYDVSDALLACLYKNATCFVFPSLYEGFGIPVLESFNCECPIVLSNTSSLPEVAGDAGHYFDPSDVNSMTLAIEEVLDSKLLRDELVEKGNNRVKNFTPEKVASETLSVYKCVLAQAN